VLLTTLRCSLPGHYSSGSFGDVFALKLVNLVQDKDCWVYDPNIMMGRISSFVGFMAQISWQLGFPPTCLLDPFIRGTPQATIIIINRKQYTNPIVELFCSIILALWESVLKQIAITNLSLLRAHRSEINYLLSHLYSGFCSSSSVVSLTSSFSRKS